MKRLHLVESHLKNNWYVDLWSNGMIEIFTFSHLSAKRYGTFHRLHSGDSLQPGILPKYVEKMVAEAIALREYEGL